MTLLESRFIRAKHIPDTALQRDAELHHDIE